MKYVWIVLLALIICSAEATVPWQSTNFSAVTSFETLDDFYRDLAQRRPMRHVDGVQVPPLPRQHEEQWARQQMKAEICESVFSADFFRVRQIFWYKNEVQFRLLKKYSNVYKVRQVQLLAGDIINEWVFGCLATHPSAEDYLEYFISAPYNVNAVEASLNAIAGRFVFQVDMTPSSVVLRMVALAEGGAVLSDRSRLSASWTYALVRWNEKPAETANLDPVCSLSSDKKLRLCSILFGSSEFKNVTVGSFEPVLANVHQPCDRRMVTLPSLGWTIRRAYEEWVIGCISTTETNERITYYVSRGKEPNTIFVFFSGINNRLTIALHHFYYNVSVVDKMYVSDTRSTVDALV